MFILYTIKLSKKQYSPKFYSVSSLGPTNVGKSTFVVHLLKHADGAFIKPIKAIYYCYSVYQPLFEDMKKDIPRITFYKALPTAADLEHGI